MTLTEPSTPILDLDTYVDAVEREGTAFAALASTSDLDALIDACPGWTVRDLISHVGLVHLWAAANIVHPSDQWISAKSFDDLGHYWPELSIEPDDARIVDWYRETLANLVGVFRSTPPGHRCLTFLPAPTPLVMWARRQASEIAIHRHDLAAAGGHTAAFDASFAADMLDELIVGFTSRMRVGDIPDETVIELVAEDVSVHHVIEIGPEGVRTNAAPRNADLTVRGTAADLYVFFWNRAAGSSLRFVGDGDAMQQWRRACSISWR